VRAEVVRTNAVTVLLHVFTGDGTCSDLLSKENPFLKHSEIALFLAIKDGSVVGRIAAVYNKTHLDTYHDNAGFFGFFDAINDVAVAKGLFEACQQ